MQRYLFVDFGGPIMIDTKVEELRKKTVLEVARKAGIIDEMSTINSKVLSIDQKTFEKEYDEAKLILKEIGSVAYNDIYRLATTLSLLVNEHDYTMLANATSSNSLKSFWKIFCGPIKQAALESIQRSSLKAIKKLLKYKINLNIVSDNSPEIFRKAFEPAIEILFSKYGLPKMEYRKPSLKRKTKNCIYISGEDWGLKKYASTWMKIFSDLNINNQDFVFFVDDSIKKLYGLQEYSHNADLKHVYPILLDLKCEKDTSFTKIKSMEELISIVRDNISGAIS